MPAARPRGPRHRVAWIAGGFLTATVATVLLCEALGWPFLRGPLQREVERRAGVPVQLGENFRVHLLFSPRLRVDSLSIGAAPGFAVPHLVAGTGVDLAWRWGDLRAFQRGQAPLSVRRLHAATLDAHLLRRADGTASWQIGSAPQAPRVGPGEGLPRFGSLSVGAGRIVLDDRMLSTDLLVDVQGGERSAAPGAGAASAAPGSRAASAAPGAGAASAAPGAASAAAPSSGYRATVKGRYREMPLDLRVSAGALLPLAQDAEAGGRDEAATATVPVRVEGAVGSSRLLFDGSAAAVFGARRLDGVLHFRGPSLAQVGDPLGLTLPRTPPFDLAGRLGHDGGVWRLVAERFTLGRSRLHGDFVYDANARPGRLSGTLGGRVLALADLGPAIGAGTPPAAEPAAPRGRVLPQRRFDIPSLRAMNADVRVAIDELDLGSAAVAPLTGLRTHLRLDAGVLRLDSLEANVAGGRLTGATRYDGNPQPPRWAADLRFAGVDIAGWVRAVQKPNAPGKTAAAPSARALREQRNVARADAQKGGERPVRAYVTGALSSEVQVTGRGRSTSEILGSLQGRAQATVRDGTISHLATELVGLDVAQALGVALRGDRPLPMRCARFDLAIENGVATPRLAVIDNRDSTLLIGGSVSLRDETLALRAIARPKDFSPLSLRTPVTIGGTLSNPQLGIDAGRLAGRAAASALLAAIAPIAALIPFIDTGTKDVDPCTVSVAAPPAAAAAAKSASGGSR